MTDLKRGAASVVTRGTNNPSSIIINHICECSMSMSLKISFGVSNGTALAISNLLSPTTKKRKGFRVGWLKELIDLSVKQLIFIYLKGLRILYSLFFGETFKPHTGRKNCSLIFKKKFKVTLFFISP